MNLEELKISFLEKFPSIIFEENTEWLTFSIDPAIIFSCFESLKKDFAFDYLFCLTCIDYKTYFTMVYHLSGSSIRNINIVVKANVDRENPVIDSVTSIYKTAEFHEREVFDLFGIQFTNHPDLRRILLTDEWNGYPLRKDYEDSINMIKL